MGTDRLIDVAAAFSTALVGQVLLVAAIPKAKSPERLKLIVKNYHLVPSSLLGPIALLLPAVEAVLAALLLTGAARVVAGPAAAGLFLLFAAAIGVNILRGRSFIECGCFGQREADGLSWWQVARNGVLACAALFGSGAVVRTSGVFEAGVAEGLSVMLAAAVTLTAIWLLGLVRRLLSPVGRGRRLTA